MLFLITPRVFLINLRIVGIALIQMIDVHSSQVGSLPQPLKKETHREEICSKIVCHINHHPISNQDLKAMTALKLLQSGLKNTPENQTLFRKSSLRDLQELMVKQQICAEFRIQVASEEIEATLEQIAQQNHQTKSLLIQFFREHGIPIDFFRKFLMANRSWTFFIRRKYEKRVQIRESEIQKYLRRWQDNQQKTQFDIQEIWVDGPEAQNISQKIYQNLVKGQWESTLSQMRNSGGSQHVKATGWVAQDQIHSALLPIVQRMAVGQISQPVQVNGIYRLVLLRNRKEPGQSEVNQQLVQLGQVVLPKQHPNFADMQVTFQTLKGWKTIQSRAKEYGIPCEESSFLPVHSLNPQIKDKLQRVGLGIPYLQDKPDVVIVWVVAQKQVPDAPRSPSREEVKTILEQEQYGKYAMTELKQLMNISYCSESV